MLHAFVSMRGTGSEAHPPVGPGHLDRDTDFLPGEAVVYRAHGVGRIDHIGRRLIDGDDIEMIQVSFPTSAMLLLIPRLTASASGLRHISSNEIQENALATIVDRPRMFHGIWAKRSEAILRKIHSGRLDHLAEVIRDLRHHLKGTDGSFSERRLFEMAMTRFASEMAAVTGRNEIETADHIHTLLAGANAKPEAAGAD